MQAYACASVDARRVAQLLAGRFGVMGWTWVEVAHAEAELLLHSEAAAGREHDDAGRPAAAEESLRSCC